VREDSVFSEDSAAQ